MQNEQEINQEEIDAKANDMNHPEEINENTQEENTNENPVNSGENVSEEEKLKAELALVQDKYLRLYSEFDNYKRRTSKERSDLFKTANQETVLAMLPILDDFERAMEAMPNEDNTASIREGILLIYNKLKSTLQQKGLKEMEAMGIAFDPDLHEAITKIPAPSDELKDKIVAVLEKGYSLHDKVIRFAKVVIGE
jgi:molecular chaperone GrpE